MSWHTDRTQTPALNISAIGRVSSGRPGSGASLRPKCGSSLPLGTVQSGGEGLHSRGLFGRQRAQANRQASHGKSPAQKTPPSYRTTCRMNHLEFAHDVGQSRLGMAKGCFRSASGPVARRSECNGCGQRSFGTIRGLSSRPPLRQLVIAVQWYGRTDMATRSGAAKSGNKGSEKTGGRKANPALMKPLQPSKELAAVVGSQPLSRPEAVGPVAEVVGI